MQPSDMGPNVDSRVHLIIVNYFSSEMVEQLLSAIDPAYFGSICVVDNSVNATEAFNLKSCCNGKPVSIVTAPDNIGFGAAVNLGANSLVMDSSDVLWILNPDTLPAVDCAENLLRTMVAEQASFASPVITTGVGGAEIWFSGGVIDSKKGRTEHSHSPVEDVVCCNFLTGAALMVCVSAWRQLNGFREDLFMYWEDADLSIRAAKAGFKLIVDPGSTVWHAVGATSSQEGRSSLFYYYMQRNRLIVLREEFGLIYCLHPYRMRESLIMSLRVVREPNGGFAKFGASIRGFAAGLFAA